MTGQEAVNTLVAQRNGTIVNIDGADAGQCTAVIHAENLLIGYPLLMGNAVDYPNTYQKNLYTWIVNNPTNFPLPGDVIVYEANNTTIGTGAFGHTGVCVTANVNNFESFEQNDEPNREAHVQGRPNYTGVWGWLHPVQLTQTPAPSTTIATVINATAGLYMHSGPGVNYPHVEGEDGNGNPISLIPDGASFKVAQIVAGDPNMGGTVNGNNQWAISDHGRYVTCAYLAISQQGEAKGFLAKVGDLLKK